MTIEFRAKDPADGSTDTDLYDVDLVDAFSRFASKATPKFVDTDGTKVDTYPYGRRVEFEYSEDGGSTWNLRLATTVADAIRTNNDGLPAVGGTFVSYDHYLRREPVNKTYTDTAISTILEDIITTFTPVNWVASNVTVVNDATLAEFVLQSERPDVGIAELASRSGDEEWGVNDSLEFFFQPQDSTRADPIGDTDVIDHDLPTEGKRAINRFTLFYGDPANNNETFVTVENREAQQDLKDKLNAPRNVVVAAEDTRPEVSDDKYAEDLARQELGQRSVIQTGTITIPLGRFDITAGDVFQLTLSDAGIDTTDFRVAQIEDRWGKGVHQLTIAENSASNMEDLLTGLSDSMDNVRARDADPDATGTTFLDLQSGVEVSLSVTVRRKSRNTSGFTAGFGDSGSVATVAPTDTVGLQFDGYTTVANEGSVATVATLNALRDVWQGDSGPGISHLGIGRDDAEPTRSENSLSDQITRQSLATFAKDQDNQTVQFDGAIPSNDTTLLGETLSEWGAFDASTGNDMYWRVTTADTDHDGTTVHTIRVELTLDDDADEQGVITTTGQQRLRDLYVGDTGVEPSDMVYGTGTTAASQSDTSLGSKAHEDAIDSTADRSTGITDVVEETTSGEADPTNWSELGQHNADDDLLSRVVFEAYGSDVTPLKVNHKFRASNA